MQLGFLNAQSEHLVPAVLSVLEESVGRNITTVFTKFINPPDSPFETLLDWPHVRERRETDLHEAFTSFADIVIEKNIYTAFTPEFERLTQTEEWDTMLICGVSTESCVLKTAVDAFERDLRPIVISDACASDQGAEIHEKGLEILEIMIGKRQIMRADELFAALAAE